MVGQTRPQGQACTCICVLDFRPVLLQSNRMYRLLFINGDMKGRRLTIKQGDLLFGSGEECHVRLQEDEKVAGQHAVIEYQHGQANLRDLGAAHKAQVNDRPVLRHRLEHGDRIAIGETIMEFHAPGAKAPPHLRRRFSKMQATSIAAISGIVLLQLGFVILFPLWQQNRTVEVGGARAEPPAPAPLKKPPEPAPAQPAPIEVVKENSADVAVVEEKREVVHEEKTEKPAAKQDTVSVAPLPGLAQEQEARAALAEARASMARVADDVAGRMEILAEEQRLQILDVERERFQASADYEEMRRLRIKMRSMPDLGPVKGEEVSVAVEFFDRVEGSGEVVSSLMRVQKSGLEIEGEWPAGEARAVSAAYVVPKGYRERELSLLGERRVYEGFRVTLYYGGKLQDRFAMPRDLLSWQE